MVYTRDVVALLKSGGARLYWALFPGKNWGGGRSTFYLNTAKKLGGPGPPGPLGDYIPALGSPCLTETSYVATCSSYVKLILKDSSLTTTYRYFILANMHWETAKVCL